MPKYHLFMSNTISKRVVLYTFMYILRESEIDFYQEMDSEHRLQENGRGPVPLCTRFVSDFLRILNIYGLQKFSYNSIQTLLIFT